MENRKELDNEALEEVTGGSWQQNEAANQDAAYRFGKVGSECGAHYFINDEEERATDQGVGSKCSINTMQVGRVVF